MPPRSPSRVYREKIKFMSGYDIIGDVHGEGRKLNALLEGLGWRADRSGVRRHEEQDRQVIFVGDLIDRGPDQRWVLETARAMVDGGTARIVMGNHEFNAICYATEHPARPGNYVRPHSYKNFNQHRAFLDQLCNEERAHWIEWFKTLPLWLELDGLRVVHACWHQASIQKIEADLGAPVFPDDIEAFVRAGTEPEAKGDSLWRAVEVVLKGPELSLPQYGLPRFFDKGGVLRDMARVRWWSSTATTIRDLIDLPAGCHQEDGTDYPEIPAVPCQPSDQSFAYSDPIPVIYGHHWRTWPPAHGLDCTSNTACVDFSAAAGEGEPLVAYRWNGEAQIDPDHYFSHDDLPQ